MTEIVVLAKLSTGRCLVCVSFTRGRRCRSVGSGGGASSRRHYRQISLSAVEEGVVVNVRLGSVG